MVVHLELLLQGQTIYMACNCEGEYLAQTNWNTGKWQFANVEHIENVYFSVWEVEPYTPAAFMVILHQNMYQKHVWLRCWTMTEQWNLEYWQKLLLKLAACIVLFKALFVCSMNSLENLSCRRASAHDCFTCLWMRISLFFWLIQCWYFLYCCLVIYSN